MKAILVIDIPDENMWKTSNDIYERMKGYKCELREIPSEYCVSNKDDQYDNERYYYGYNRAIRDCVGDNNVNY